MKLTASMLVIYTLQPVLHAARVSLAGKTEFIKEVI